MIMISKKALRIRIKKMLELRRKMFLLRAKMQMLIRLMHKEKKYSSQRRSKITNKKLRGQMVNSEEHEKKSRS